jgi:flagellar biosynthesis chaperone FliJ
VRDSLAQLGERVQARRMLERLRERHFAEWSLGVERHEREVMDSLARRPSAPGTETTTPTNG